MAKDRIGVVKGTFLVPGVSKNNRLYTREMIQGAVKGMQERIKGGGPLTMFSSHNEAYSDNALSQVGRITKVNVDDDGNATFEADIADTAAGRDLAALVTPKQPYLKGVSIRGAFTGDLKTVEQDGKKYTTADGLQVTGIDFTGRPGVEAAGIAYAKLMESAGHGELGIVEDSPESELIVEVDASSEGEPVVEDADDDDAYDRMLEAAMDAVAAALENGNAPGDGKLPYGKVKYADPGYQKDGKKRYPIDTAKHVRAAWSYINKKANADKYTSAQVGRIKSRIKAAAKKFGINISAESEQLIADIEDVLEAYASMSVGNNMGSISTSGYTTEPKQLKALAQRIAMAAMAGMSAMDPDDDGDIDMDDDDKESSDSEETDNGTETPDDDMESSDTTSNSDTQTDTASTQPTEAQVATDNQSGATEAAPAFDYDKLAEALLKAQQAQAAPAAPAEAAPDHTHTASTDGSGDHTHGSTQEAAPGAAGEFDFAKAVEMAAQKAAEAAVAQAEEKFRAQLQDNGIALRRGFEPASEGDTSADGSARRTLENMTPAEIAKLPRAEFDRLAGEAIMEDPIIQRKTLELISRGVLRVAAQ